LNILLVIMVCRMELGLFMNKIVLLGYKIKKNP